MNAPLILRRPEVVHATGLSYTSIFRLMREGRFPRPVKLSAKASGWIAAEVSDWLKERMAERDGAEAGR